MLITVNDILKAVDLCKGKGWDVKVSDLIYVYCLTGFDNKDVIYKALFGKPEDENDILIYNESPKIAYLKKYVSKIMRDDDGKKGKKIERKDITFEENKEALINLLADLRLMTEKGEIEKKDAVKMETDIRTKLNDKFAITEKQEEHRVVVSVKYNNICEWTHRECFLQTKEYAKKNWGLVEMEELLQQYDLVPKIKKYER